MAIQRMEHVGIVVDDLAAATEFFVELGLELQGEGPVEGRWVDRVVGLDGVRAEIAMLQTPDGHGRLELTKFHTPSTQGGNRHAPANTPGIRHVAFAVEDIDALVADLRAAARNSWAIRREVIGRRGLGPLRPCTRVCSRTCACFAVNETDDGARPAAEAGTALPDRAALSDGDVRSSWVGAAGGRISSRHGAPVE